MAIIFSSPLTSTPDAFLDALTPTVGTSFIQAPQWSNNGIAGASGAYGVGTTGARWANYYCSDAFPDNQYVDLDIQIIDVTEGDQAGLMLRADTVTEDFYAVWIRPNQANPVQVWRCDAGTYVSLQDFPISGGIQATTYNLRAEITTNGAQAEIEVFLDTVSLGTVVDTDANRKLSGHAGIILRPVAADALSTNFEAGDFGNSIIVSTPENSFRQRNGATGTAVIDGTYSGTPASIERNVNNSGWVTAIASPSGGTFQDSFQLATGENEIQYRFSNETDVNVTLNNYVIGDVFVGGPAQSNLSGRGTNNQTVVPANGVTAYMLGNDDQFKVMADPTDDDTNQVDAISADATAAGSWIVLFANRYLTNVGVPICYIPCPKGGTTTDEWQKNSTDRIGGLNLYESMARRVNLVGGSVHLFLAQLGESDASDAVGTTASTYQSELEQIANDINLDFGAPTFVVALHQITAAGYNGNGTTTGQGPIRQAQIDAATANANIYISTPTTGIDISDGDGLHFQSNVDLDDLAEIAYNSYATQFIANLGWRSPPLYGEDGTLLASTVIEEVYFRTTKAGPSIHVETNITTDALGVLEIFSQNIGALGDPLVTDLWRTTNGENIAFNIAPYNVVIDMDA